jgi:hypothetical protein
MRPAGHLRKRRVRQNTIDSDKNYDGHIYLDYFLTFEIGNIFQSNEPTEMNKYSCAHILGIFYTAYSRFIKIRSDIQFYFFKRSLFLRHLIRVCYENGRIMPVPELK